MSRATVTCAAGLPESSELEAASNDCSGNTLGIHHQVLRYVGLSALSFAGNLGLIMLLHEGLGISSYIAVPIAMACMTTFNFFTVRLAIFRGSGANWLKQFTGFIASIAGFRIVEYLAFVLLYGVLSIPYLPAYASILIAVGISKFLFLRNVLFAGPRNSSPPIEQD